MNDFLIEFYNEEMPSSFLEESVINIKDLIKDRFLKEKIKLEKEYYYFTAKRITIIFCNMKIDFDEEKNFIKGPRYNSPEKAVVGFAKSLNTKKNNLVIRKTEKGKYYFFKGSKKPEIKNLLISALETELKKIAWKKSMKWGSNTLRWARPLINILCIYNNKKISFKLGHLESNDKTYKDHNLSKKLYKVKSVEHYFNLMKSFEVMIKQEDRKVKILSDAEKILKQKKLTIKSDEALLKEVSSLVEKPFIFLAEFRENFLKLPEEILITTMKKNQKYFPTYDMHNKLSNFFILVSNIKSNDRGKILIEGNQRVINARLEDAVFFWERDKKQKLETFYIKLNKIIFHNEIGTMLEKVERLKLLVLFLSSKFNFEEKMKTNLTNTVSLLKNDLATEVVKEFPELQGIMGSYYAKRDKNNNTICKALYEQYKPQGPNDNLPSSDLARYVAMIDKLDTLIGFFIIERQPTSSKDPFALRRTALGIIRIVIEGKINIDLSELILKNIDYYKTSKAQDKFSQTNFSGKVYEKILSFILERYENLIKEKLYLDHNILKSLNIKRFNLNLLDINNNLKYLSNFFKSESGLRLLGSMKRVINIVSSEKELNKNTLPEPNIKMFETKEEINLYNKVKEHALISIVDYKDLMKNMLCLIDPIQNFFDNVQIHHQNKVLRKNRIELMLFVNNRVNKFISFHNLIKGN